MMAAVTCSSWAETLRGDGEAQGGRDHGGGFAGRDRECESPAVCRLRGGRGRGKLTVCAFQKLTWYCHPATPGQVRAQSRAARRKPSRDTWWGQERGTEGEAGLGVVGSRGEGAGE